MFSVPREMSRFHAIIFSLLLCLKPVAHQRILQKATATTGRACVDVGVSNCFMVWGFRQLFTLKTFFLTCAIVYSTKL